MYCNIAQISGRRLVANSRQIHARFLFQVTQEKNESNPR
jgi:hypothetical protein